MGMNARRGTVRAAVRGRLFGPIALWLVGVLAALPASFAAGIEVTAAAASEGAFGLRLNLGPDCASPQDLTLDADDGPLQGVYEACRTISAASVAVAAGAATLRAGDLVSLDEGFQVSPGADLTVVLDGALNGGPTYVEDSSPIEETLFNARFSVRVDDLALGSAEQVGNLIAFSSTGESLFRLAIEPATAGGYQLTLEARLDGGGMVQTPSGEETPMAAGWNVVELAWAAGDGYGSFLVGVNGGSLAGLTDLANGTALIESVRWGGVDGAVISGAGSLELDSFSSTR